MPRKAPAVIVDNGFALMSRICMLRGNSVSFIQRRRLLVMELQFSNNNQCVSARYECAAAHLSAAICWQVPLATLTLQQLSLPSRLSRVGRQPTARNVTTVSHKMSFYFWACILLSSPGFSWPAHTVHNGALRVFSFVGQGLRWSLREVAKEVHVMREAGQKPRLAIYI